jgi:hypothetical protein
MVYKIIYASQNDLHSKNLTYNINNLCLILEEKVNALMNDGWLCSGNVSIVNNGSMILGMCQTMIKI